MKCLYCGSTIAVGNIFLNNVIIHYNIYRNSYFQQLDVDGYMTCL